MSLILPSSSLATVDSGHSVNWGCSLNKGLLARFLALPPRMGGLTWKELTNRYTGTLTSMDPATDWVSEGNRTWLNFDGSNDYVTLGQPVKFPDPNQLTIAAWANSGRSGLRQTIVGANNEASVVQLEFTPSGATVSVDVIIPGVYIARTGVILFTGGRHHIVYTRSGTGATHAIYLDGVSLSLTTNATNAFSQGTGATEIGRRAVGSQPFSGNLDDLGLWGRPLSATEVWQVYEDSRTGYLKTLNRRVRWFPVGVAAGGGTVAASLTDGLAAGDTLAASLAALASTSDGADLGDTQAAVATLRAAITEGAALGESWVAELVNIASLSEGTLAGDSFVATLQGLISLAEGTVAGDVFAASVIGLAAISEGVAAGDAFVGTVLNLGILADGISAGDTLTAVLTGRAITTEGIAASDTLAARLIGRPSIAEGASLGDSLLGKLTGRAAFTDGASLGDTFVAGLLFSGAISEGVQLGDTFAATLASLVAGPYRSAAGQVFCAGMAAGQLFSAGQAAGEVYSAGAAAGQVT